jgi:hypothetical protein
MANDILKPEDYEILRLAQYDIDYFGNYFLRTEKTGTLFTPESDNENILKNYKILRDTYVSLPDRKSRFEYNGISYIVRDNGDYPTFFYNHGVLALPWHKKAFHAPQPESTIVGGFGSGKTFYIALSLMALAAMLPGFQGYAVAPLMDQAMQTYRLIKQIGEDTPWMKRWVTRTSEYRNPGFTLQNDFIGESKIGILSIESDPQKVLTLEGDVIFLDQAEKFQNLDEITRALGSRLRGTVRGRNRLGRLCYLANSSDNDEFWYRFDLAEVDPKTYFSLKISSSDNTALSKKDLTMMAKRVGGTEKDIAQHMDGERPEGQGEKFSKETIERATDESLNETMKYVLETRKILKDSDPLLPWYSGFIVEEAARTGVFHWEMPPDHKSKRVYLTVGDPGMGIPPYRNAPCIMVWDITDFPKKPAVMRAFNWIFGNGNYWPFVNTYIDYVHRYHCKARNAFDATGTQKAFDQLIFEQEKLITTPMDMSGMNSKAASLNALLLFMQRGIMKMPRIAGIRLQLSRYKLPDSQLAQDTVMVLAMTASYLREYYYHEPEADEYRPALPAPTYNRYPRDYRKGYR